MQTLGAIYLRKDVFICFSDRCQGTGGYVSGQTRAKVLQTVRGGNQDRW
jgi:hypothetical protein